MASILSATKWNLMRDPNPRAIMARKSVFVIGGYPLPPKRESAKPDADLLARSLMLNPAVVDFGVRQTAVRPTE